MDPLETFAALLERAKQTPAIAEATGMTLSTVGADGRPTGRIVLLKGIDARGLVFYTNTLSRKGGDIRAHPGVALTFWWPQLESQVRFEGPAVLVSDAEADAYFATRPRVSQLGAWASHQSAPLAVEFWQSRPGRLHHRERHTRSAPGAPWTMVLLNP